MDIINVTKTYLPPLEELQPYLERIWANRWITNQGPLLKEFEKETANYLGISNLQLVSNGTLALQIAIEALGIDGGEIITTPFSYVATVSSILWQRCTPVFVDIDPETLCIDPQKIENSISSKTKAILPVHVFGNPCDVEAIEGVASKHSLPVIYDAAHAFGVEYKGRSLLSYGNISVCSFHATKLFHTIEGGAIHAQDNEIQNKIHLIKKFGHDEKRHYMLGINAKANEIQAAMGLCNLKHINKMISDRQKVSSHYDHYLKTSVERPKLRSDTRYNYAYYPVIFKDEKTLIRALKKMEAENIYPRRYFYPSLNKLPYIKGAAAAPVSEDISKRILCLPLYPDLQEDVVRLISNIINETYEK